MHGVLRRLGSALEVLRARRVRSVRGLLAHQGPRGGGRPLRLEVAGPDGDGGDDDRGVLDARVPRPPRRSQERSADPPSISRSGRSISVWSGDQLRCFLDAMADHELYPLYLLAATTGMRRGELAGLPWSNVDLDAARLTVNQQIVSVQYQLIEGNLKTPTSRRSIDLDLRTVAELRRHRRRQLEERMATGQRGDDGYVFAKPDGSPIHPDLISQTFERAVAKLDVPRIRLHDLRHTHATTLLQQNVHPKVVSERLGHSSVAFTMTVYQHVMPGLQAQAASTFETAVFGQ